MGPNFELFAGLFIYMRASENAILIDYGREWNGPANRRACALCRVHDFPNRLVQYTMIKSLELDPNLMFNSHLLHISTKSAKSSLKPHDVMAVSNLFR